MNENLGIIETLQGQVVSLTSLVAAMRVEITALGGKTVVTPPPPPGGSTVEQEMLKELARSNAGTVELDKDGIPWDERIHAKTKTKTTKDIWKKGKGIDPAVFSSVMAELIAAKTTTTPPAATAGFPAVAGAPPGVAVAGTPPAVDNPDKTAAMAAISLLTDEFGIPYESVLSTMNAEFGAKSFDELPVEQYPVANQTYNAWVNEFRQCDEEVEKIVTMGGDNGQVGVNTILSQNGVTALKDVPYSGLRAVTLALTTYREQLDTWVAGQ